jgi:carboxyl-terminal processing protease
MVLVCSQVSLLGQNQDKPNEEEVVVTDTTAIITLLQSELVRVLKDNHISPPEIDDAFSTILFSNWLDLVDPNRIYLLDKDIQYLSKYLLKLDDEIHSQQVTFFEESYEIFKKGRDRVQGIYSQFDIDEFDFAQQEEYIINPKDIVYVNGENNIADRYTKYVKYQILVAFNELLQSDYTENAANMSSKDSLMTQAITEVLGSEEDELVRQSSFDKIDFFGVYLDAISSTFDPYSEYYSTDDKESYDINATGKVVGAGVAILQVKEGALVSRVLEGGPAWRSNNIVAGDTIVGITKSDGEFIQCEGMILSDIAHHIRGPIGTSVTLVLQDKNAQSKSVEIVRDEVISYDQTAKGLLLKSDISEESIGYIDIRNFYQTISTGQYSSSSVDVISYLNHFEKEGITSIVIDLRDNLGGVLEESIYILEALLGETPLLQVRDKSNSLDIYSGNRQTPVYTGDILVLTNQNTASAAEILASTLQDYGRAIIVGSQTYGKGTIQEFVNLDELTKVSLPQDITLGEVKCTIAKYYRVNGQATQLIGVTPHIVLPSILDSLEIGERYNKNPIGWSEIDNLHVIAQSNSADKLRLLNVYSKLRVTLDKEFSNVKDVSSEVKSLSKEVSAPLTMGDFRSNEHLKSIKLRNASNASYTDYKLMEVMTVSMNNKLSMSSEESRWMALRSQDIYINEAIHILNDVKTKL